MSRYVHPGRDLSIDDNTTSETHEGFPEEQLPFRRLRSGSSLESVLTVDTIPRLSKGEGF